LLIGSELEIRGPGDEVPGGALTLVCLVRDRYGYGRLSALVTRARRRAKKGAYRLDAGLAGSFMAEAGESWTVLFIPKRRDWYAEGEALLSRQASWLGELLPEPGFIGVELSRAADDGRWLEVLEAVSADTGCPLVAAGNVQMHARSRRPVRDVLTAVRLKRPVSELGHELAWNGERHLRSLAVLADLYPPALLGRTLEIALGCEFSLEELRYEYPEELVPGSETPAGYLRRITESGMDIRWPEGAPVKVRRQVESELALINELGYEPYFLTVHDLVRFARERGILCQGRGSAANSAVCYCLGITEVDPARSATLFERFISRERNEPPDIDVDFEHERREEVIQYLYRRYGRERAALCATVITYRPRSAVRDVGKALGMAPDVVERLARSLSWWEGCGVMPERLEEAGFDPESLPMQQLGYLTAALVGFPRHLSQHVGGFVISRGPLSELVPIENAAMADRTVIQWDKDDLDALGFLKIDILALGMLSAIRRALDLIEAYRGRPLPMSAIPAEDPAVYRMLRKADTVGVFQVESRAQMAMLPRLGPQTFYDLVIEVAIVRPGPIQGGMVHPYLRRRQGLEPITYPSKAVEAVLSRTLGIPIFQEQVMQLAVVAAGFTPGEADALRRAMAAWRRKGGLGPFEKRLIEGMRHRGYSEHFARQIFQQIQGFGEYGFPESHSASFALLVYVSAWLKCHEPAAFTCALLNSQPMGFYAPAQLVRDAVQHGVEVRPVDVLYSGWDCSLEPGSRGAPALRLGLRMIKGLREEDALRIVDARAVREGSRDGSISLERLAQSARLTRKILLRLADAGALRSLAGHRHRARWAALGFEAATSRLISGVSAAESSRECQPRLPRPTEGQDLVADYAALGFSLERHPLALLRERLERLLPGERPPSTAADIRRARHGQTVRALGLVIGRQRPSTASGVIFMTLEDETGFVNAVVWPWVAER